MLRDVKHILDIHLKLMTMGIVTSFVMGNGSFQIGDKIIARGQKVSTLYKLQARLSSGIINIMENELKV